MKLVFIDSKDNQRELGIFETVEEAENKIKEFLEEKHFKSPYWRKIYFDNKLTYDVGSWYEFFVIYYDDNAKEVGVWDEA